MIEARAVEFTEQVARELAIAGWEEGLELAKEKGETQAQQAPRALAEAKQVGRSPSEWALSGHGFLEVTQRDLLPLIQV